MSTAEKIAKAIDKPKQYDSIAKTAKEVDIVSSLVGRSVAASFEANHSHAGKRTLPVLPKLHPDPFTPEAAGGILSDIAAWITSTAIIPVPELSLAASIALLSGMFGDKALAPTRAGINLFFVTVMGVASGKGHAPKSISALARDSGKPGAISNGDPTSYAAIERILRRNKSTVLIMDEFGCTLQDVNSTHKNSAATSIRKFLLTIYDQADSVFDGRQYASSETKKDDSPIEGPALTILGMTTEGTLYSGLNDESIGSGFISRFIFVTGTGPETITPPKLKRIAKPPADILKKLKLAVDTFPKASEGGKLSFLGKFIVPFEGDEEGEAYARWSEVFLWQHWKGWEKRERDINGRIAENTLRLATVRAISRNPQNPAVTADDIEWGWSVAYSSLSIINDGVTRHMSGSKFEALCKAILAALDDAPHNTRPWSLLLQRSGVSQAEPADVSIALQWLIDTGKVINLIQQAKPGAKGKFCLVQTAAQTADEFQTAA